MLKEIHQIEKSFPLPKEKGAELKQEVEELAGVCDLLKDELEPLERQVREAAKGLEAKEAEELNQLSTPGKNKVSPGFLPMTTNNGT
ncbi:hypothetical protein HPP92_006579 [Vanilla planifolia]|uniref:Uncharacterized protein n=1 Tax=Vanilla planifolia TaxID=51239 RepID=A0A835VB24_VANPL|nr:hypothetical protein HPP92_006579 [Vanilla planifolia]